MIASIVIIGILAFSLLVVSVEYRIFREKFICPDKIIHIVYETSPALAKARRFAENVLQYIDDKDLTLEAQQVIEEINKAEKQE